MSAGVDSQSNAQMLASQYALLGEFVVKFEWINVHLRFGMEIMIEGLSNQKPSKLIGLFADASAYSLLGSYRSVLLTSDKMTDSGKQVTQEFYAQVNKLIERRNEIIHGTLVVGWPNESIKTTEEIIGFKSKNYKDGTVNKPLTFSLDEMRKLILECEEITARMVKITACYITGAWESIF